MGRLSKTLIWLVAGLAALFAIAAIAFFLFFDPSDFRDDISKVVKESTGRDLVIDGEVELQLFPWLAVEVGHATLGNAAGFGDEPFAEFDRARLSVRLLPLLLRREVTVGSAELEALKLNLVVTKAGLRNWSDLIEVDEEESAPEDSGTTAGSLEVSGVEIRDSSITYVHKQKGDAYSLSNVNLRVGRISSDNEPVPASGSLHFDVQPIGYSGDIEIETEMAFDKDTGAVLFNGSALEGVVEGLAEEPTRVEFSTDGIIVDTVAKVVTMQPLELAVLDLDIGADLKPFSYADEIQPTGAFTIAPFSPRGLMTLYGVEPPETADPNALGKVIMDANFEVRATDVRLTNVSVKLDDTSFTGSLIVPMEETGAYRFDLVGDALDLNRYMEPASEAADAGAAESAPVEIPADLIEPLNARGDLKIATVTLGNLQLEQVVLGLNTANGRMRIHPVTADLYGGKYSGDVSIDVTGAKPTLSMNESVQGVSLAGLARAMFEQDNITGTINGNFKLAGRGNDMGEVQKTLEGNMSFVLKDGTYEGTDIWYELRRARAMLKQETPPEPVLPPRTKFSSVTASGVVNKGVLRNEDLVAELPFMQITGRGNVDIAAGTVDYNLRARVFKRPEALVDATPEEVEDFTKTVIPLKITGSLASPKVAPDVEELLLQRVEDELKDKLKDKLKDLFE